MPLPRLSLRLKLTVWYLAVFSTIYVFLAVAGWLLHRDAVRQSIDRRLLELAESVSALVMREPGSIESRDLRTLDPFDRRYSILSLRDPRGKVLVTRGRVDTSRLPPVSAPDSMSGDVFTTINDQAAEAMIGTQIQTRMITHRFTLPDGKVQHLDLIRTADMRQEEQTLFLDVFVIGAVAGMIASMIAAWLLAGRAVAPLQKLALLARGVTPEHIETRFKLDSPDQEVERLQSELNDALARLEAGYHAQERFISNVAHELKTPIAVMLTESQVLQSDSASRQELAAYQRSMIEEMQRLGGLVESFLTLARASQQDRPARQEVVAINDVVVESVATCDAEADQFEVQLVPTLIDPMESEVAAEVVGDPDLLSTMLNNLIRNAIRFSPPAQSVDIVAALAGECIRLTVRDRGPGIPKEHWNTIFDRFVQVHSDESRSGGTGLGLAIVNGVVEMHGGKISVRNCEDGGCEFAVLLPLASSIQVRAKNSGSD